jgi:putative endonuclease
MKNYYVYILASRRNGVIYIGITNDLIRRIEEHKLKLCKGFTTNYGVNRLVYFEEFQDVSTAIQREKRLKEWPRRWKLHLIERENPYWNDLYDTLLVELPPKTEQVN